MWNTDKFSLTADKDKVTVTRTEGEQSQVKSAVTVTPPVLPLLTDSYVDKLHAELHERKS